MASLMKLGRKPRRVDPRVPHLSTLLSGQSLAPVPAPLNWANGMNPVGFGMMLNNELGDCTCAGWGHQKQIWTFNASGTEVTTPDASIKNLYERFGYVDGDSNTDNGAIEQDVLNSLLVTGLDGDKLTAYFEVDVRNHDDVKRTIAWCGGSYIGLQVPAYVMQLTVAGSLWDAPSASDDTTIEGGHCVLVVGFDDDGVSFISWGALYRMTWGFWDAFVDEAYGLVDPDWVETTGETPANLTIAELQAQMAALTAAPTPSDASGYHTHDQLGWFKQ